MIELEFVPRRAALLAGQDNTLDVLVRGQSPCCARVKPEAPPLNLAHCHRPLRLDVRAGRWRRRSAAPP